MWPTVPEGLLNSDSANDGSGHWMGDRDYDINGWENGIMMQREPMANLENPTG